MENETADPIAQDGAASGGDAPKAQESQNSQPQGGAKESGAAPWAKDLGGFGLSPEHYQAMDNYLRTVWQPRMTQHEQDLAKWNGLFGGDHEAAQIAHGFFTRLEEDPQGTYANLGELLGLTGNDAGSQPTFDETQPGDAKQPEDQGQEQTPEQQWIHEQMQRQQAEAEDKQYEELLGKIEDQYPQFDRDLFSKLVVAHQGDIEQALQSYVPYHKAPEPPPEAPPTAGGGNAPAPNEAKKHGSLRDAINNFMAEQNAARSRS